MNWTRRADPLRLSGKKRKRRGGAGTGQFLRSLGGTVEVGGGLSRAPLPSLPVRFSPSCVAQNLHGLGSDLVSTSQSKGQRRWASDGRLASNRGRGRARSATAPSQRGPQGLRRQNAKPHAVRSSVAISSDLRVINGHIDAELELRRGAGRKAATKDPSAGRGGQGKTNARLQPQQQGDSSSSSSSSSSLDSIAEMDEEDEDEESLDVGVLEDAGDEEVDCVVAFLEGQEKAEAPPLKPRGLSAAVDSYFAGKYNDFKRELDGHSFPAGSDGAVALALWASSMPPVACQRTLSRAEEGVAASWQTLAVPPLTARLPLLLTKTRRMRVGHARREEEEEEEKEEEEEGGEGEPEKEWDREQEQEKRDAEVVFFDADAANDLHHAMGIAHLARAGASVYDELDIDDDDDDDDMFEDELVIWE